MSHSGGFTYDLRCFRFTSPNPLNEMKRFFIGDCKNYTNIDWIAVPTTHEVTLPLVEKFFGYKREPFGTVIRMR